ncbi:hypothetical protein [Fibrella aquatilis]|uniref:Uncharacterized protein n=1 Tax=Fibrella aquatilis TaxID=2817059 RepID=A0A939G7T0_9BACT|nr:hypothetical protein [Fibrella aquatilis]MBO0932585.1 hypothetical protein [Fibrella aquatilis]
MTAPKHLSNIQVELLKLYANDLPTEQLHEIKLMLARYFAQKATEAMDKQWDERGFTEQDMVNWTNEHNRQYKDTLTTGR